MTRDALRQLVFEELSRLAPEADLSALPPTAPLRADLDLDSYDFVQFIVALDRRLGVEVPEVDYRKLETLEGCLDYLEAKHRAELAQSASSPISSSLEKP
jgi:acyl carrier protein